MQNDECGMMNGGKTAGSSFRIFVCRGRGTEATVLIDGRLHQ
jgi:hypothetical protein